jgi:hypothetical protein
MNTVKNQLYLNRYLKFINSCKLRTYIGYTENHHILPESMGGSNEPSNMIKLSAREHFIAHWMLWKAYQNKEMTFAFWCMKMNPKGKRAFKLTSKTYSILKEQHSKLQSERNKIDNPMFKQTVKDKLRKSKIGTKASEETKLKMSIKRKGIKKSEETKLKMSLSARNKPKNEEHKNNLKGPRPKISGENNPMHGRSAIKEKNLKWYTNGLENKFIPEDTQPNEWYRGRVKVIS